MKNNMKNTLVSVFLLSSFLLLLLNSSLCISYASRGLLLWFEKMIPTLFPFMVFSGFIARSNMIEKFSFLLTPLSRIYGMTPAMSYGLIMGFTCGFPMGAKVVSDLYETNQITKKQGEYLLAFCNNIGPGYLTGYVFHLFHLQNPWYFLIIFYTLPLLYGYFLRFLPYYKGILDENEYLSQKPSFQSKGSPLYTALEGALTQINFLGGCMILFNCLQIYPLYFINFLNTACKNPFSISILRGILSSLTEIGGGLLELEQLFTTYNIIGYQPLLFSLLTIGGLSCIVQTRFILEKTGLSIKTYFFHKLIQSILIFLFLSQITQMLQ